MKLLPLFILVVLFPLNVLSQTRSEQLNPNPDPRGPSELTICSQNLANFGAIDDVKIKVVKATPESLQEKKVALVERFKEVGCDVIAVQEIVSDSEIEAIEVLNELAEELKSSTNRFFEGRSGTSNDRKLRLGYLVAKDRAEILNMMSYSQIELPRLLENEKIRFFSRGPLEMQLNVKGRNGSGSKILTLVNFHFKSKWGAKDDPAALEWETYRLEMAEALRTVVENRHARAFASGDTLLAVVGDRNSNFDSASAKVLEGTLTIKNFQEKGACRLSKRGAPLCQAGAALPQRLFSVLLSDPQTKVQHGTFVYKGEFSWLDEILMPAETLRFAWAKFDEEGDYDSGIKREPYKASDHAMVYVRLNW